MDRNQRDTCRARALSRLVFGFAVLLCSAALVLSFGGCANSSTPAAARFGSHTISEDEITTYTQEYREKNNLQDDTTWLNYLVTNGKTAETWRQEVIRQFADKILIQDKANELGISADLNEVQEKITQAKENAGIDVDDEQAWAEYLAERGQTPQELQESYEASSVEQQVYKAELKFDDEVKAEMCDDYISSNLADQVVCHYAAIAVPLSEKDKAKDYEAQLEGLTGEALTEAFSELVEQQRDASAKAGLTCGDIGWDFTYDEWTIDPDLKLRKAKLEAGQLYQGILKGTDAYRVVMCTEWASFAQTPSYDSLESESLKQHLEGLAMVSNWTAKCMEYMSDLEEQAGIQISTMPDGLPYDVAESLAQQEE